MISNILQEGGRPDMTGLYNRYNVAQSQQNRFIVHRPLRPEHKM